ncbi:MAG TPA: hypothetical protein VN619_09185 [Lacisediminihabitans sp.]|nr:hypothetical protein [Lacisediminihabitans sp.]HXD62087.1 hypothetical protein [Lacisediminihabitans sp.]
MTGIATHGVFAPGLSTRGPESSVLEECLRAQLNARQRGVIARFFGVSPLRREARADYRAALSGARSATVYSRLGEEFTVLEAIAGDGPDHLIIGPPGIFTVTTKSFSAKRVRVGGARFMVNGRRNGCVEAAKRDAEDASLQFSDIAGTHIEVTPVIVVVEPRSLSLHTPDVAVTESARVARWFAGLPRMLSDDTIDYLSTVAELPGRWQPTAEASHDAERHAQRFDRLRREVEAANRRARSWLYVGLAVLAGGAAVAAMAISDPLLAWVGLS